MEPREGEYNDRVGEDRPGENDMYGGASVEGRGIEWTCWLRTEGDLESGREVLEG